MKVKITNGNPFKDWYFKYMEQVIEVEGTKYTTSLQLIDHPEYKISGFDCVPVNDGEEAVENYDFSTEPYPTTQEAMDILRIEISKAISNFELSTQLKVNGVSLEKGNIKIKFNLGKHY